MNNKGQTLVLFLFVMPLIFLILVAFYQFGSAELEKKKIASSVEEVVRYGMDYKEEEDIEEKMVTMFQKSFPNIKNEFIEVKVENEKVSMTVKKEYAILFMARPMIRVSYVGENIDGKVQIIKE